MIQNTQIEGKNFKRAQIDMDTAQETVEFFVGKNPVASVTAQTCGETAWSTGILTLKWRLSRDDDWRDFPTTITITQAAPTEYQVDVLGTPWLGVQVSTIESGVRLNVSCWCEGEEV